ncbi:MAG: hypothetical protein ACREGB_04690 [Candidatus Saccharimonadales bacterium]
MTTKSKNKLTRPSAKGLARHAKIMAKTGVRRELSLELQERINQLNQRIETNRTQIQIDEARINKLNGYLNSLGLSRS